MLLKNVLSWIVLTNLFVAFCVVSLAMSTELMIDSYNNKISLFVFFSTIFVYNLQRIIRLKRNHNHSQKDWIKQNFSIIMILVIISAVISSYLFFEFQLKTQILILFIGIISILYPFGLREIPFIKIYVIALVWMVTTVLLIIIENHIRITQNIMLLLIGRFFFVLAITIPFDIRDLKYDHKHLKTIPIIFGKSKSILIAIFFLFIFLASSLHYYNNQLHLNLLVGTILTCVFILPLIIKSNEEKENFYFSFWVESVSIILFLFLFVSSLML